MELPELVATDPEVGWNLPRSIPKTTLTPVVTVGRIVDIHCCIIVCKTVKDGTEEGKVWDDTGIVLPYDTTNLDGWFSEDEDTVNIDPDCGLDIHGILQGEYIPHLVMTT